MIKKGIWLLAVIIFTVFSVIPQTDKLPPDSHQPYNFTAKNAMVVAAHPLAVRAGVKILQEGGNAVDAAVATALALNAAEPFASGIGGGGFMVIYTAKERTVTVINYREKAPSEATPDMFIDEGKVNNVWRKSHGLAVAVPGALSGWTYALRKYGTMALSDVIQEAVKIAEEGFLVSKTFSKINKDEYEKLLANAGESSCYLNQGFPFEPGDTFRNPDLAKLLKAIAKKGVDEFYTGEIAAKIVAAVREKEGIINLADLADYSPIEHSPTVGKYKEYTLYTTRPPSCGGVHMIQLLNIIENWPVRGWGHNTPTYIHHLAEAFRFVFADRARFMGDPKFFTVPTEKLISKDYARHIVSKISPDHAADSYPFGEFDDKENLKDNTTHLCVIDQEGNIVSLTQSINHFFGSGIVPEGTGFLLNNHMDDFSPDPGSPNSPAGQKRPVSNMGPLILMKDEKPFLVLGSPGGTRIFPSLTQIILNITEFGMTLDEAIEAPRFFSYSVRGKARNVFVESRIAESTLVALKKLGHTTTVREEYDKYFGGAQGIMIFLDKKIIHGGADSRRDGYGAGY